VTKAFREYKVKQARQVQLAQKGLRDLLALMV
jgi:hypothetical protein